MNTKKIERRNEKMISNAYFQNLYSLLTDPSLWDANHFIVMNHEAGTGKSRNAQEIFAEIATTTSHRILYVIKFKRNNEMKNIVSHINNLAHDKVAFGLDSDTKKSRKKWNEALNSKVLVITHSMYKRISQGLYPELMENRQILVIDEKPNLTTKCSVELMEIGGIVSSLYGILSANRQLLSDLKMMVESLTEKFWYYQHQSTANAIMTPFYIVPTEQAHMLQLLEKIEKVIKGHPNSLFFDTNQDALVRLRTILRHPSMVSQSEIFTFSETLPFVKMECNVILDANASMDPYYTMSDDFILQRQPKVLDFSGNRLIHYDLNTSKTGLSKNQDAEIAAFKSLDWSVFSNVLVVTDLNRENIVRKLAAEITRIEGRKGHAMRVEVTHFGNLIGVNRYRTFDTAILLKTPFLSNESYGLDYLHFSVLKNQPVLPFTYQQLIEIKNSAVAGEMYQALARINRDHNLLANYIVFTANAEALKLVRQQMQNIHFETRAMSIHTSSSKQHKVSKTKQGKLGLLKLLSGYMRKGFKEIDKRRLRDDLGLQGFEFSRVLKEASKELKRMGVGITRYKLEFQSP